MNGPFLVPEFFVECSPEAGAEDVLHQARVLHQRQLVKPVEALPEEHAQDVPEAGGVVRQAVAAPSQSWTALLTSLSTSRRFWSSSAVALSRACRFLEMAECLLKRFQIGIWSDTSTYSPPLFLNWFQKGLVAAP